MRTEAERTKNIEYKHTIQIVWSQNVPCTRGSRLLVVPDRIWHRGRPNCRTVTSRQARHPTNARFAQKNNSLETLTTSAQDVGREPATRGCCEIACYLGRWLLPSRHRNGAQQASCNCCPSKRGLRAETAWGCGAAGERDKVRSASNSRFETIHRRLHLVVVEHLIPGADVRRLEPLAAVVPT